MHQGIFLPLVKQILDKLSFSLQLTAVIMKRLIERISYMKASAVERNTPTHFAKPPILVR